MSMGSNELRLLWSGFGGGDLEAKLKWLSRLKWISRVNDTNL